MSKSPSLKKSLAFAAEVYSEKFMLFLKLGVGASLLFIAFFYIKLVLLDQIYVNSISQSFLKYMLLMGISFFADTLLYYVTVSAGFKALHGTSLIPTLSIRTSGNFTLFFLARIWLLLKTLIFSLPLWFFDTGIYFGHIYGNHTWTYLFESLTTIAWLIIQVISIVYFYSGFFIVDGQTNSIWKDAKLARELTKVELLKTALLYFAIYQCTSFAYSQLGHFFYPLHLGRSVPWLIVFVARIIHYHLLGVALFVLSFFYLCAVHFFRQICENQRQTDELSDSQLTAATPLEELSENKTAS
jgi:hypothetical protein